ncbi:MAG: chemotaxis protein CheB [Janthinobacterium lividum]
MPRRDIVVIGASIGGVEAVSALVGRLPPGFGAAVFVSLSLEGDPVRDLPDILGRAGPLRAVYAGDGEEVVPGQVHVVPPGGRMLREGDRVTLPVSDEGRGGRQVDLLFESAALAYGERVVGVVLTGWDGDGAAGLAAIGRAGGARIVQDPREAAAPSMPLSALSTTGAEVLPLHAIAARLVALGGGEG